MKVLQPVNKHPWNRREISLLALVLLLSASVLVFIVAPRKPHPPVVSVPACVPVGPALPKLSKVAEAPKVDKCDCEQMKPIGAEAQPVPTGTQAKKSGTKRGAAKVPEKKERMVDALEEAVHEAVPKDPLESRYSGSTELDKRAKQGSQK